jgi:hypothetical protein
MVGLLTLATVSLAATPSSFILKHKSPLYQYQEQGILIA